MRALWPLLVLAAGAAAVPAAPAGAATRMDLHGRCVAVEGEPTRLQAAALGEYLLMARDGSFRTPAGRSPAPTMAGIWRADDAGGDRVTFAAGEARIGPLALQAAEGCATFPEAEVNVAGQPRRGATSFGHVTGLIDTHLHGMAFEFLGGSVHCGRPWHPLGITAALVDCPDHGPDGRSAVVENFLAYGNPSAGHRTDGWPSFQGWPSFRTYTHEQVYHKWLERAWRGGLRLSTNLLLDNHVVCDVYPRKRNSCNEMDSVRLQHRQLRAMVDYVDAQSGGPGKGWLRIVRDPFEARRVINDGRLALVIGIETSRLFGCGEANGAPTCTKAGIDRQLEEVHAMGVRQMELVNKEDNGLVGVAGDDGTFGVLTNHANKYSTGHFWAMETCRGTPGDPAHDHDKEQTAQSPVLGRDALAGGIARLFLRSDDLPAYPPAPHCNAAGLTDLGAYLIRRMMDKGMLLDPDHMSVKGRDQALSLLEARRYGGVLSSHSWSTPDAYRRILALGGLVTPAPKTREIFLAEWEQLRAWRPRGVLFGTGWSTDMNGFAAQGPPRPGNAANPVRYPFRALDGSTSIDRNRTGTRTWDVNLDGTAHFGMYPDVIEDLRIVGGEQVAEDLRNGAEAYLQMWERAEGIRRPECRAAARRFLADGLGEIRLGMDPVRLLRSAGQPAERPGRAWRWCVSGTRGGSVRALLSQGGRVQLVGSTAPYHRFAAIGRGASAARLARTTRRVAPGVRVRSRGAGRGRVVFGVRRGRVTFAAVASRSLTARPARLRSALRLAHLR